MKVLLNPFIALTILSAILISGCNLLPEPVNLIQAPTQVKSANQADENLFQIVRNILPAGTILTVPNEPAGSDSIIQADLDSDGSNEIIAFYKSTVSADKVGALILQKDQKTWKQVQNITGTGYEISWGSATDIAGDGKAELLPGWKIGVTAGNVLNIYNWESHQCKKLTQLHYHELELIYQYAQLP